MCGRKRGGVICRPEIKVAVSVLHQTSSAHRVATGYGDSHDPFNGLVSELRNNVLGVSATRVQRLFAVSEMITRKRAK